MATAGKSSGTIIQALQFVGKDHLSAATIEKVKSGLSDADKKSLKRGVDTVPDWMRAAILQIAG
jgi:hypothetical protein